MINSQIIPQVEIQDQLQNKLLQFIDYVGTMAQAGMDKAGVEIPLLLKEVATYRAISNGLMAVMYLFAVVFLIYIMRKIIKLLTNDAKNNDKDITPDEAGGALLLFVILGACCIPLMVNGVSRANECLKATFAPRVYIVEWGFDVYNGNNKKIKINK